MIRKRKAFCFAGGGAEGFSDQRSVIASALASGCTADRHPARKLRQNDSAEHDHASGTFSGAETLPEQQPSGQNGNTGFQAQNKRSHSGIHSFLAYDLQGVGYAAGHNACIQNGNPGVQKPGHGRVLKKQGGNSGKNAAHKELDAGHFYSVYHWRKMIDHQNVQSKQDGADQNQKIALSDRKTVIDAEQIKTDKSQNYSGPDKGAAFFF